MFDFERLELYQVMRNQNKQVIEFILGHQSMDEVIRDQWKRSSIASVLHLTEGASRIMDTDKKHFFTLSRGSIYECTALLQLIYDLGQMDENTYIAFYNTYEQISKMLLGMYRSKS